MNRVEVELRRTKPSARMPARQTAFASGFDLFACLEGESERILQPGSRALIPTGLAMAIPRGYEGQVRPRSGLALRHGVSVLNSPGTIDADYRGEVAVILINFGEAAFRVAHGDRIAQIIFAPTVAEGLELVWTEELGTTDRGGGGFGSTGMGPGSTPS